MRANMISRILRALASFGRLLPFFPRRGARQQLAHTTDRGDRTAPVPAPADASPPRRRIPRPQTKTAHAPRQRPPRPRAEGSPIRVTLSSPTNRRDQEALQIRMTYELGHRLFCAGDRERALTPLREVLEAPLRITSLRVAAACYIAETHRGLGAFAQAEDYYRLSLGEAEGVEPIERPFNEFYSHFQPRAILGLIMTLRRSLHPDRDELSNLLRRARSTDGTRAADHDAQLLLLDGCYLRQLGQLDMALSSMQSAREKLNGIDPPYQFLHPEHFDALIMLACFGSPRHAMQRSRLARRLIDVTNSPWSIAMAAAVLIHQELRRDAEQISLADHDAIDAWLDRMKEPAQSESDPLVISEYWVLRCARSVSQGRFPSLDIARLVQSVERAALPTRVLRAVELGVLIAGERHAKGEAFIESIITQWNPFVERLEAFTGRPVDVEHWRASLDRKIDVSPLAAWSSDEMNRLRMYLWP